jgi:hypothetical protein
MTCMVPRERGTSTYSIGEQIRVAGVISTTFGKLSASSARERHRHPELAEGSRARVEISLVQGMRFLHFVRR